MANYIFIDTNLYRNLLQSENTAIIDKIVNLTEHNEYKLLLPQQVIDEINRGRSSNWFNPKNNRKIIDLKTKLEEIKPDFGDSVEIDSLIQKIETHIEEDRIADLDKQRRLIDTEGLVEVNLKKLKDKSVLIEDSQEIMQLAQMRVAKGNPPYEQNLEDPNRKNKEKICDSYIWELLKNYFSSDEREANSKLLFYSNNKNDWCQKLKDDSYAFHPFLLNELRRLFSIHVEWYESLEFLPELTAVQKEEIKNESLEDVKEAISNKFIPGLLTSNSWDNTDRLFRKYSEHIENLSEENIKALLKASIKNNQLSFGPYNQVLLASEAVNFFSKLFKFSNSKGFPVDMWLEFYKNMDKASRANYEGLKNALLKLDYYFDEEVNDFIYIPF